MIEARRRQRNAKGDGEKLRDEIVAAATLLIDEEGPQAVTLRGVARRAGVTAPAIYAHFDDIFQLRRAVVARTFAGFADYLRQSARGKTAANRLRTLCRAYVRYGLEHPRQYTMMFGPVEAPSTIPKSIENMPGSEAFAILLDAIEGCVEAGVSTSARAAEDATAVWVGLHGYVGLRAAAPDFPWPKGNDLLDAIIDRLAQLTG